MTERLAVIISSKAVMWQQNSIKMTKFCNGYIMFSVGKDINV
jgi:hypothetical protein